MKMQHEAPYHIFDDENVFEWNATASEEILNSVVRRCCGKMTASWYKWNTLMLSLQITLYKIG